MDQTLYEYAGGEAALLALAEAHHARCLADPELNHPFSHPGQHPDHVARLAAYWGEVLGGPPVYSTACGTQAEVVRMHCGNGDISDLNRRFLACFLAAMDDAGLPGDPRFRASMQAFMESSITQISGRPDDGAGVPDDAPVPRVTWVPPR